MLCHILIKKKKKTEKSYYEESTDKKIEVYQGLVPPKLPLESGKTKT